LAVARPRKIKRKSMFTIISVLVILAVIIGCIVSFVVTQSSLSEMQAELQLIKEKTQEVEAENVELQRILEDDDMNAYMEKIAIEEMNYAYPNERRYYDTSRN
jgi:cell division protein FtsL